MNVIAGGVAAWGDHGAVALQTNDDEATRSALEGTGFQFREVQTASAWLDDQPGTFADAARRLANAGVNIEAAFPIGMKDGKVGVLFGVDNVEAAKSALGRAVGGRRRLTYSAPAAGRGPSAALATSGTSVTKPHRPAAASCCMRSGSFTT